MQGHVEQLTAAVYDCLAVAPSSVSEYTLLREMQARGLLPETLPGDNLALFRVHFLLFHALHRLRDRLLWSATADLSISPLSILLRPYDAGTPGLAATDPLRAYYLDLENLRQIGREEVETLLSGFWNGLSARDRQQEALAELELEAPIDFPAVKRQYRRLAMRHHPDRGGDGERLQAVNRAMAVLERCYRG